MSSRWCTSAGGLRWLEWDAPAAVRACSLTKLGGVSEGAWRGLNVSVAVGDAPDAVAQNRALLVRELGLPSEPVWIDQVHGNRVLVAERATPQMQADALVTSRPGVVCGVMSADCLPVFLVAEGVTGVVALAHAGWRGLVRGVLPAVCAAMPQVPEHAWLGPCIGASVYEVGEEVRDAVLHALGAAAQEHFAPAPRAGHWYADLPALARMQLLELGVGNVSGGEHCTHDRADLFYSHRRDGVSGRLGNLIWLEG